MVLYQDGIQIKGTTTDINGIYEFKEIPKGEYELTFSFLGYTSETKKVKVKNQSSIINSSLTKGIYLKEVVVEYERPVSVCSITYRGGNTRSREEIERLRCYFTCGASCIRLKEVEKVEPKVLTVKEPKLSQLQIFPNPSVGGEVTLLYDNHQVGSENEVEITLIDLLGKSINRQQVKLENGRVQLQIKELEGVIPGQYFIIVTDGEKKLSQKVIVQ